MKILYVFIVVLQLPKTESTASCPCVDGDKFSPPVAPGPIVCTCPYGKSPAIIPANYNLKCKDGPAGNHHVNCREYIFSLSSVECPRFRYIQSWHIDGEKARITCCGIRGLRYKMENCRTGYNFQNAKGQNFYVGEGYMTGWRTFDAGLTFCNKICTYDKPYQYYYNHGK